VTDDTFDAVYAPELRRLSAQHFTPVPVAARAAALLIEAGARRVLDVGSGAGKFCIVGALTTPAVFVGIERRAWLVAAATEAARRHGAARATFLEADALDFDFTGHDGVYLFNPFRERVNGSLLPIGADTSFDPPLYLRYVEAVQAQLAARPPGTAVVTCDEGFGGTMPEAYRRVHGEDVGGCRLVLWRR
jgi:hypothetical protein